MQYKDTVLIRDTNKYSNAQIGEVISRCHKYTNLYGELSGNEDSQIWGITAASHTVCNIKIEGSTLVGDITVLKTFCGKTLLELCGYICLEDYIRPSMYGDIIRTFNIILKSETLANDRDK